MLEITMNECMLTRKGNLSYVESAVLSICLKTNHHHHYYK
ncbi:hypothetical protein GCM10025794_25190 [Massilia kyonggiensis]